jgi:hypothetical protein
MGFASRLKSMSGSSPIRTVAAAAEISIPDDTNVITVTGTTAVTHMHTGSIEPGRRVRIYGGASSRDFVNASSTTIPFRFMLGSASEIGLAANDVLELVQLETGAWLRLYSTDN